MAKKGVSTRGRVARTVGGLTPQEALFVDSLVRGRSLEEAHADAGYSCAEDERLKKAHDVLDRPAVQAKIRAAVLARGTMNREELLGIVASIARDDHEKAETRLRAAHEYAALEGWFNDKRTVQPGEENSAMRKVWALQTQRAIRTSLDELDPELRPLLAVPSGPPLEVPDDVHLAYAGEDVGAEADPLDAN